MSPPLPSMRPDRRALRPPGGLRELSRVNLVVVRISNFICATGSNDSISPLNEGLYLWCCAFSL